MAAGDYFNPRMYVEQRLFDHFDGFWVILSPTAEVQVPVRALGCRV